jgi:hypothetical protein
MRANDRPNDEPLRRPEDEQGANQIGNIPDENHSVPLFLRNSSDGRKGDAQDEKDETAE